MIGSSNSDWHSGTNFQIGILTRRWRPHFNLSLLVSQTFHQCKYFSIASNADEVFNVYSHFQSIDL